MIDKKSLSERDICTKFITPAIEKAGWDKILNFLRKSLLRTARFTCAENFIHGERQNALTTFSTTNQTFLLPLLKPKTINTPSARDYSKA